MASVRVCNMLFVRPALIFRLVLDVELNRLRKRDLEKVRESWRGRERSHVLLALDIFRSKFRLPLDRDSAE